MFNKKTIRDVDLKGRRALVRVDFNVPLKEGEVKDDTRILAALPTIQYLIEHGAAVILCSHLGRPKDKPEPEFTLRPVAERLSELLKRPVAFCPVTVGPEAEKAAKALKPGEILLLENTRFQKEELLVGGGMANTFLAAKGLATGDSLVEVEALPTARELLRRSGDRMLLPTDLVIADAFDAGANHKVVAVDAIPAGWRALDIGPETVKAFTKALKGAKLVVWNGPMGVFEFPAFAAGTKALAKAVAKSGAISIVGGGDSASAVHDAGVADRISHISTGGGASLEFLEGKTLPGVAALLDK